MVCVCSVAQSCPALCDPTDCSLPCSSVHGIFPGKNTGVGCHSLLLGIFPTQGTNPGLHCRWILYQLSHKGSPVELQADSLPDKPKESQKGIHTTTGKTIPLIRGITPVFLPGKIPWTEEPGRLQSTGSQRVGCD